MHRIGLNIGGSLNVYGSTDIPTFVAVILHGIPKRIDNELSTFFLSVTFW